MHHGHDDRLEAVHQDLHAFLEQQLGDLLGVIRAAEAIGRQVKAIDDEMERKQALVEHVAAGGHTAHAAQLEREAEALGSLREQLVDQLAELTSSLHV
jgi:hypothetical protein